MERGLIASERARDRALRRPRQLRRARVTRELERAVCPRLRRARRSHATALTAATASVLLTATRRPDHITAACPIVTPELRTAPPPLASRVPLTRALRNDLCPFARCARPADLSPESDRLMLASWTPSSRKKSSGCARLLLAKCRRRQRFRDEQGDLQRAASSVGNRGFGQLVARMRDGEGILSGGLVHPDVEAAIAASQGRGRRLAGDVSRSLEATVGDAVERRARAHRRSRRRACPRRVGESVHRRERHLLRVRGIQPWHPRRRPADRARGRSRRASSAARRAAGG